MIPIIAILSVFGMPALITFIVARARLEAKKLEYRRLELTAGGGSQGPEARRIIEDNRLLRERVENLESIVCSVDFELNQKLSKLLDEQRSLAPGGEASPVAGGGAASPGTQGGASSPAAVAMAPTRPAPVAGPAALDKTASAPGHRVLTPPATTALEPGQVLAQRYRVQRLLGKGGMGAVYLADDEVLGELVALKVISSAFAADEAAMISRFRREAAAARKVSSPSVIRIHDLGEARPGLLYLSMEYFAGRTLSEVIAQRGIVPLKDVQDFLIQIGTGLEAAHQAGVVHRDLKPSNVLVGERGMVKLIDFGLATTAMGEGLTATGAILGTPHYMAPEQVRGKAVDARTDIYALGALAYHLVCGRPPFAGDNPIAIGFAHISEPVVPPRQLRRDLSPALDAAIVAALAKSPEDRPSSAKAFIDQAFAS
ncbi:MAG TPA: serine/threonine-protein kinase [Kofleriaceae bacterium]|nr:serine/threonine-protein kinase [Kofleriaceae bacterium]